MSSCEASEVGVRCQALVERVPGTWLLKAGSVAPEVKLAKGGHICYNTRRSPDRLRKDRMTRLMRKLEIVRLARREVEALLRLNPWLLASLLLAAVLWFADLSVTSGLFQSPPASTPTGEPSAPVLTPTLTLTLTLTPSEAATPTVEPTATTEPTVSPTPTEVPATPTEAPATITPAPSPTGEAGGPEATDHKRQRYSEEGTDLKYDWDMLFDTVALAASYLWLCCGVLVLVAIPAFFVVLWVAGKRRRQREE